MRQEGSGEPAKSFPALPISPARGHSNEAANEFPLALFRGLQDAELLGRQVLLNSVFNEITQILWRDRVELDADVAKALGTAVACFGRPRRQRPIGYLGRCDRQPLEMDFGFRRHLAERLLDLLARVHA